MQTIRIRISDKIYKNIMELLKRFGKDEIQVINEDAEYLSVKEYLDRELADMEQGKTEFIGLDQLERDLERTIRKHED